MTHAARRRALYLLAAVLVVLALGVVLMLPPPGQGTALYSQADQSGLGRPGHGFTTSWWRPAAILRTLAANWTSGPNRHRWKCAT